MSSTPVTTTRTRSWPTHRAKARTAKGLRRWHRRQNKLTRQAIARRPDAGQASRLPLRGPVRVNDEVTSW